MHTPNTFEVSVFQEPTQISPTLSKSRVRIFYKGLNRNSSYITEPVAEKLLATLPYAPVKGIYEETDYTDHGARPIEGKAYGFIPNPANIAWEEHEDRDGIVRTYACADVILWTGLYEEASQIVGSPQSMELYPPLSKGEWRRSNGQEVFFFEDAAFLGLQVLGQDVEPAFEGAGFFNKQEEEHLTTLYTFYESLKGLFEKENYMNEDKKDEGIETPEVFETDEKDIKLEDENVETEVDKVEEEEIVEEKNTQGEKEEEVEEVEDEENTNLEFEQKNLDLSTRIVELEEEKSTLETERDNFSAKIKELEAENEKLTNEITNLNEYKSSKETDEKRVLLEKYQRLLKEETIATYTENLSNYSLLELDKELAWAYTQENSQLVFSSIEGEKYLESKFSSSGKSSLETILDHHKQ